MLLRAFRGRWERLIRMSPYRTLRSMLATITLFSVLFFIFGGVSRYPVEDRGSSRPFFGSESPEPDLVPSIFDLVVDFYRDSPDNPLVSLLDCFLFSVQHFFKLFEGFGPLSIPGFPSTLQRYPVTTAVANLAVVETLVGAILTAVLVIKVVSRVGEKEGTSDGKHES